MYHLISFKESFFKENILRILKIGNKDDEKILRSKSKDIELKNGKIPPEIKELVKDMFSTIWANGAGIAAPQVGKNINLFVIKPSLLSGKSVFINPKIISKSNEVVNSTEGCLSVPFMSGKVIRNKNITVKYIDLDGKEITKNFSGFTAIVIQHEYDHLQGILYIDRIH